ncbi:MAG TPA: 3-carboxy-cis,cis-muconate cycloisomerase [Amaricoccus sp.]|nr:3-carboxy-cis,cis-muconate cycloisomerase [Amaricoccus sp.]
MPGCAHPWLAGLLGDAEVEGLIGPDADLAAMLAFETALAGAEAAAGVIPADAGAAIAAELAGFRPDMGALAAATARDGVVVPELVRQLRAAVGEPHAAHLHFGATSQDVIDTSLVLRLKAALPVLAARLDAVIAALDGLEARFGDRRLMGRTRMQAAIPITAGARIASWRGPLARQRVRLEALLPEVLVIQFGGAAGTLDTLGGKAGAVRAALAAALGLGDAPQWQSQRDRIAALAGWLATTTGALGKLGQDVALMAQAGGEIVLAGGGSSSAMPHKANPVGAEVLVALARFNAVQSGGMQQAMVHEQERSGAAWTLEWLLLPPMLIATGAALRRAGAVVASIEAIGD